MKINESNPLIPSKLQSSQIHETSRFDGSSSGLVGSSADSGDHIDLGSQASLLSQAQTAGASESSARGATTSGPDSVRAVPGGSRGLGPVDCQRGRKRVLRPGERLCNRQENRRSSMRAYTRRQESAKYGNCYWMHSRGRWIRCQSELQQIVAVLEEAPLGGGPFHTILPSPRRFCGSAGRCRRSSFRSNMRRISVSAGSTAVRRRLFRTWASDPGAGRARKFL